MPSPRAIVFLTDFGLDSEWVGTASRDRQGRTRRARIDLSHFVEPLGVEAGARLLSDSMRYLPEDAIVLAVVDPNVGADRDIAVEANDGRIFVGPTTACSPPPGRRAVASPAPSRSPRRM